MPHPELAAPEPRDWHAVLDRELSSLAEKYRLPVILCDLEGRMRREAARQLGIAEGTLASRLATARRLLAKRLARHGIGLSAGALATTLASQAAGSVSPALVSATAKSAVLIAAGRMATLSTSVHMLMKGALTAMYLSKLKTFATVLVAVVVGTGTIFYASGSAQAPPAKKKPASELETLREENELLKVNLRATLERIRTLERQVAASQEAKKDARASALEAEGAYANVLGEAIRLQKEAKQLQQYLEPRALNQPKTASPGNEAAKNFLGLAKPGYRADLERVVQDLDSRLKTLREVHPDSEALRRAAEILEDAARKLRKQGGPMREENRVK